MEINVKTKEKMWRRNDHSIHSALSEYEYQKREREKEGIKLLVDIIADRIDGEQFSGQCYLWKMKPELIL